MTTRAGIWAGTGLALLLASCASLTGPEPVRRPALEKTWEVPEATLVVPVRIPRATVQSWSEAAVPERLQGKDGGVRTLKAWFLSHDWHYWWSYDLVRTPLVLGWHEGKLRVSSRISGELKAWWDTLPGEAKSQVEAEVGVEAELGVAPDWTLTSRSRVLVDLRRAEVPIGIAWDGNFFGETISIAGPVAAALKPSLASLETKLDQAVAGWSPRPLVEAAWKELQAPRALAGAEKLWFSLDPRAVALGPLGGTPEALQVDLVLTARPRLTLGERPVVTPSALPPAGAAPPASGPWVLDLPISLDWDEAARAALARLPGGQLKLGSGGQLQIRDLRVFTDADRVLLRLEGRVTPPWPGPGTDAVLWVGARPVWDASRLSLRFTEATLDIQTRDLLAQAASWLLNDTWVCDLESSLRWEFGAELEQLRSQASLALTGLVVAPHLTLSVALQTLSLRDFRLTNKGVDLWAQVAGEAQVTWSP